MADALPTLVTLDDLTPFASIDTAKANAMIEDAIAQALTVAPCLTSTDLTYVQQIAVRGILRTAILRWDEAGTGAKVTRSQSSGGLFTQSETLDTTQERRGVFWPSEIRALQAICKTKPRPYTIDMGGVTTPHTPWCARNFGANYCDCGVELGMDPQ